MYALLQPALEAASSGDVTGNRPVSAYCADGDPVAMQTCRMCMLKLLLFSDCPAIFICL